MRYSNPGAAAQLSVIDAKADDLDMLIINSMNEDPTNFFAPNTACLRSILGELGFSRIDVRRNPGGYPPGALPPESQVRERDRHIVHARR